MERVPLPGPPVQCFLTLKGGGLPRQRRSAMFTFAISPKQMICIARRTFIYCFAFRVYSAVNYINVHIIHHPLKPGLSYLIYKITVRIVSSIRFPTPCLRTIFNLMFITATISAMQSPCSFSTTFPCAWTCLDGVPISSAVCAIPISHLYHPPEYFSIHSRPTLPIRLTHCNPNSVSLSVVLSCTIS